MNIWFQLALGVSPAVIVFLVLTIISWKGKRFDRFVNTIALAVFSAIAIWLCVAGFAPSDSAKALPTAKQTEINLELACAVAGEGNIELASKLLVSMHETCAESAELTECEAYFRAVEGDAVSAKALIIKANMLKSVEHYEEFVALCDGAIAEGQLLMGQQTPEKHAALIRYAAEVIEESVGSSKVENAAKALVEAEELYEDFLKTDNLDQEKAAELAEKIGESCKKCEELGHIKEVRLCRMKLLVLAEEYAAIAQEVDGSITFDELAIVAELYINNAVENGDFTKAYGKDYVKMAKAVAKQVKKIGESELFRNDPQKKKDLQRLVDALNISGKEPAIGRLKMELSLHAEDASSADRPKAYMQLARMAYVDGDDEAAAAHISAALNTVGVSDDESFATPMVGIVDSITDKDNIEKVKDIAQYAEDVTNNSSDYIVVKSVEKALEKNNFVSKAAVHEDEEEPEAESEERGPFEAFFADTASQKRNAFSITSVDATEFETVKLVVNVDPSISITEKELKGMIEVKDCNVNIEDFTVEKVTYSGANILLCCDTSGSMSGQPIDDLRNAVRAFVESASDVEDVALVTFNGGVDQTYKFGTDKELLISAAGELSSGGGTNMYGAILKSIEEFAPTDNTLSFILLMSDGADGTSHSAEAIQNNIGAVCKEKGIVLFSLGLGDNVNAEYMNTLATVTGGYFVYVNDSATLDAFYTKLRSQILNRYIITYRAKDTLRASRDVTVSLKDSVNNNVVYDTKQYYLNGTDADVSQDGQSQNVIGLKNLSVSGLDTRRVFKNSNAVTVNLKGTKFTDQMVFNIKLDGKLNYENIPYTFVDSQTLQLTLPGGMACDVYDLVVDVDGQRAVLTDELTVSAKGMEKTTTFGNYVFTSDTRIDSDDGVLLSGYVTMNGWLHFNGDVRITGDLDGYSIRVSEQSGSYIKYYADTATGLAQTLANRNIALPISPLGSFNIYNDTYSQGESPTHRVDTVALPMMYMYAFECKAPGLEVYPDKILVKSDGFTTKFPMQDTLLKAASLDDLFTFDLRMDLMLTNKAIDVNLEFSNKPTEDASNTYTNRVPANFGMFPIYTTPATYEVKINTNTNEYWVDFAVKVAFIDSEGIGLRMVWGQRDQDTGLEFLVPKTVELKSDTKIHSTLGTVPVTYRNFKIGLDDIDLNTSVLNWKLIGSFDLESTKVSDYIPKLADYIDDPAIIKLEGISATLSLGQRYIGLEATCTLLEAITLGKLSIEAGNIPYTCELLGMYDEAATGMKAAVTLGVIWKTDNVDINVSGTGIVNLHTKFLGIEAQGVCDLTVEWWILEKEFYQEGRTLIGFYTQNNTTAFIIKARETTKKGSRDVYLIVSNGELDYGVKKL